MEKTITGKGIRIDISKNDQGMGVWVSYPEEETGEDLSGEVELVGELIDFLSPITTATREKIITPPEVKTIPLPKDTSSWVITETPYIWKGQVVVSQDSLSYYTSLLEVLRETARTQGFGMTFINCLRRAETIEKIIDGLQESLGNISEL